MAGNLFHGIITCHKLDSHLQVIPYSDTYLPLTALHHPPSHHMLHCTGFQATCYTASSKSFPKLLFKWEMQLSLGVHSPQLTKQFQHRLIDSARHFKQNVGKQGTCIYRALFKVSSALRLVRCFGVQCYRKQGKQSPTNNYVKMPR